MYVSRGQKRALDFPGTGVTDYELSCRSWDGEYLASSGDGGGLARDGSEGYKTPHTVYVWSLVSWSLAD